MKSLYRIFLATALLLPTSAFAGTFNWYDGGHVTFSIQKKYGTVVDKALDLFSSDMQAVTGKKAEKKSDGKIDIYQLDQASNKEMSRLKDYGVPLMKFITRQDAFWLGVRQGKLVVVGSNGRGTAYGILELSRLAGVSPWRWWGDVVPERKARLSISDHYETLQIPSVEYRGIELADTDWSTDVWDKAKLDRHGSTGQLGPKYFRQLFCLMLRLRANTLWTGERHKAHHKKRNSKDDTQVADSFDISLSSDLKHTVMATDDGYGYLRPMAKNANGMAYHLSYSGEPHDYLWLATTQPGLIYNEMRTAWNRKANHLWVATIHDPKVAAYPLSLFMDMAWDVNSVSANSLPKHLEAWLTQQFGERVGNRLVKPMAEFYRLCGIRRPEFMGWNEIDNDKAKTGSFQPVQDTEFNAEQFGNELERYLNDFKEVKAEVDAVEPLLRPELKDAFFAAIKYPVYAAAAMATKQLQAQEARTIGRQESFHHDEEALESAVRSWKAYEEIQSLTTTYNDDMAKGKWKGLMNMQPRLLPVFQAPQFIDNLTTEEIKKYDGYDGIDTRLDNDGCVVRNAYEYSSATDGVTAVEMLGHSMRAVALPKGDKLSYQFYAADGDAVLRTALIPTQPADGGELRYSVSIDDGTPIVHSIKEDGPTERWKVNVLRGQAVRTDEIHLTAGTHKLTIQALDDHIVVDQWMIDYDRDRQFYMFPIK